VNPLIFGVLAFDQNLMFGTLFLVVMILSFLFAKIFEFVDVKVIVGFFSLITVFLYFWGLLSTTFAAIGYMLFALLVYIETKGGNNNVSIDN